MIGGLGGLGKIVALWMVENGARDFVFLSRSGGKSAEDQHFKRDMENAGCRVVIVAGSVVEKDDVETAVAAALSPIAGVIQMSMVLKVSFASKNNSPRDLLVCISYKCSLSLSFSLFMATNHCSYHRTLL